jgi:WD40 repeat protein
MRAGLAGRLSRVLVGCYPRRWRQRYGPEMLEVLDQHQASTRTVLNLAAGAISTHLDPAYWTERSARIRLSDGGKAAVACAAVVLAACTVFLIGASRDTWHLSGAGGVGGVAFAPGRGLLVSAVGGAGQDSMDTVWSVTDPARPRRLSAFQGGDPTVLSPDGRIVATLSYGGQPVLWNVANPRRPARVAIMPVGGAQPLWGEAFSPDGQILAVAYTDRIFLWDVASAARPRLLGTLAASVPQVYNGASFSPQDIAFSPDGRMLASVTGTGHVTVWNVTDPPRADRTATLTGLRDFVQAIAFSPRGGLLAVVTYHGTVLVFSLADPARPARTATISGIMADALYPDGLLRHPDAPPCPLCSPANYAVAFAPDGRTLTVVVARQEGNVIPGYSIAARDTVFTWNVTSSGAVGGLTTVIRDGEDSQPALAPNGRTVADGSPRSNAVHLWTPPEARRLPPLESSGPSSPQRRTDSAA